MSSEFSVKNKIIAVTGGGSGIGLCYVILARAQGAKKVIIADISLTKKAQEVIDADSDIVYQKCDVIKWNDLQALIDDCKTNFGDVPDVFVASAGVLEPSHSNFWHDPEPLEANRYFQVDININHPIKLTRLAIRALLGSNKSGVVVLLGSTAGYAKQYMAPLYCATKYAITGFAKSMGEAEKYQGVRVVAVCPGIVSTPQWTTGSAVQRFKLMGNIAISPENVAQTIQEAITQPSKYPGGAVIETLAVGTRVIPEWNVDPPNVEIPAEAIENGIKPILAATDAERGGRGP
ncbi:NAD(P)-binding protein [Hyaloscypha variabilis]